MASRKIPQDSARISSSGAGAPSSKDPAATDVAAPVRLDPAASAALAEAIRSAKQEARPARPPLPAGDAESAKAPRGRLFGASVAAQTLIALALIGAGWSAAYVGTLANREAFGRVEAETARSQEILARLSGDLEALKGTLAAFRDVEQTSSIAKASDQAELTEKVERLAIAVQDPGRKISALEAKLDRMESQITANLATLAAKTAAPAPVAAAVPAPPPPPAAAPAPAAATPPAPAPVPASTAAAPEATVREAAVKSPRNEPVEGWVLREVYDGAALIESQNRRLYEVAPGGVVPGIGRVEGIERRGRSWVVLTEKGFIGINR
jgi:hypothetical protein